MSELWIWAVDCFLNPQHASVPSPLPESLSLATIRSHRVGLSGSVDVFRVHLRIKRWILDNPPDCSGRLCPHNSPNLRQIFTEFWQRYLFRIQSWKQEYWFITERFKGKGLTFDKICRTLGAWRLITIESRAPSDNHESSINIQFTE